MNLAEDFRRTTAFVSQLPWFFRLWIVFVLGSIALPWVKKLWERYMLHEAQAWPVRKAQVISADVSRRKAGRNGIDWKGLLTYSYYADGMQTGTYVHFFNAVSEAEEWAQSLQGRMLAINVHPTNGRRSRWLGGAAEVQRAVEIARQRPLVLGELTPDLQLLSGAVMIVSGAGMAVSVFAQIAAFSGTDFLRPERDFAPFFLVHLGAVLCAIVSYFVTKKRFPGRRQDTAVRELAPPWLKKLVYCVGIYSLCVFLWCWVKGFLLLDLGRGMILMFAAGWSVFYLSAFVTCWVARNVAGLPSGPDFHAKPD